MEQKHVFQGYHHGEKDQWSLLSDQIVSVNSKLLEEALQSLERPAKRQVNMTITTMKLVFTNLIIFVTNSLPIFIEKGKNRFICVWFHLLEFSFVF